MKEFKIRKGNYIKDSNSTMKMMYHVIIALVPIILFSFYKNGIYPFVKGYGTLFDVIKPLILLMVSVLVCLFTEYLFFLIKKDKKSFYYLISESFAILPGIFIGLIIPINTPIWLVIIASFLASISKMLFGGLGKNKLNPALVGASIIIIFGASYIGSYGGYLNSYEIDAISGATPLSNYSALSYFGSYSTLVSPYGSLWSFLFGNIPGAIGETNALLCIIAFLYLTFNKVIKWRISVSYVLSVFFISLIVGVTNGLGLWYPVFFVLSGSLLFGATFMVTDPVTSPVCKHGQIVGGIILGVLTCFVRYMTSFPEGVLISILIFNVITIFINRLDIKFCFKNSKVYKIVSLAITIFAALMLTFVISNKISDNKVSDNFNGLNITDIEKSKGETIYYVTSRGYSGNNSIKSKITFSGNDIISFEVLSSNESYYKMIKDADYLNLLVNNQNNLDNVDAVTGATYTSKYLKDVILKIKEYNLNNK